MSRAVQLAGLALLALAGCIPLEQFRTESTDLASVPTSPFPPSVTQNVKRAKLNYTPAEQDLCWRVDAVGRKLVASNPLCVVKPAFFSTIGAPDPEIFHPDFTIIYITAGLVQKCTTEAELAAVLASELGKMVSEREAAISREARVADPPLPIALPISGQGNPLAADPTHYIEMAKYEKEHPRSHKKIVPPPDPHLVAQSLLENAGFQKSDLDAVAPLLRTAEQNYTLERQYKGMIGPGAASWQAP